MSDKSLKSNEIDNERLTMSFNLESVSKYTFAEVINQLVNSSPKGIFLLDDPPSAIGLRLAEFNIPNKQCNREKYYEVFISALHSRHLSAISVSQEILDIYDMKGTNSDKPINKSILLGIRLDMGIVPLNFCELKKKECFTEGSEYLGERLEQCANLGVSFARWRSVYTVLKNKTPTHFCINRNTKALAHFADITQSYSIVPIIEIELLKMGNYSIEVGSKSLEKILASLTNALIKEEVDIQGTVLQVSMVSGGEGMEINYTPEEIAEATLIPIKRTMPAGLGGVAISSGGLSEELASTVLNAIALQIGDTFPWPVTFAFGRSLQHSAFKAWAGLEDNLLKAQEEFKMRQEANNRAMSGTYTTETINNTTSTEVLYTDKYVY